MEAAAAWAMVALWTTLAWVAFKWKSVFSWRRQAAAATEAHRHFVAAAKLLALARARNQQGNQDLARDAVRECDVAISLEPRDAAAYIVKALALEHLGHSSAAVRCMSMALSPPASKSLSELEKADALLKKASMSLAASNSKRACRAIIDDVQLAFSLNPSLATNAAALNMLSTCYRKLGIARD